ncbi:MAG: hypothetical protein AseanaTS_00200 [Candidatus Pelagadaptatus aseana]
MLLAMVSSVSAGDLTIELKGIEVSRGGSVTLALYRDAKSFATYDQQNTVAILSRQVEGLAGPEEMAAVRFRLDDVMPGQYAIHYFHDQNGNQRFDFADGQAMEGWGISRARHMWQALSFDEAAFTVNGAAQFVSLKTFYAQ